MEFIIKISFLVIIFELVPMACVELDLIDCGVDHELEVTIGDVDIKMYPWIGILYYTYHGDIGETRAVTTVVLIQKEFVIANAADIGPMPKHDFRKKSRVLLGERWPSVGRRVRSYVLHPQYGRTHNTLALVQLRDPLYDTSNIKPACPAPEILRNPVFYVMKFHEDLNDLKKVVIPVAHVPSGLCREFYMKANLYSKKMRPPHVACAVSLEHDTPCVWEAGAALVARDVWGRWQLLGVGSRGPGCGAPARFLDMSSYGPWIRHALERFQQITITKMNKQKYILRKFRGTLRVTAPCAGVGAGGGRGSAGKLPQGLPNSAYQRFGSCDPEEKDNLIFREYIKLVTDNTQFQFLTYNMTIQDSVDYTCLTLELVNASATSEMRVVHFCPRPADLKPCHYYKGSAFDISVFIIFSDECSFEMYAWGHMKSMILIDTQEWRWEEGTYYEDFTTENVEYRGQAYMTDFGYEPIDQKMWVPEYDMWTTTAVVDNTTTTTTVLPPKYPNVSKLEPTTSYGTTTRPKPSTLSRKRTFRRKTTTGTPKPWSLNKYLSHLMG